MIALSKTVDVRRDHLIHRKRSPFPYEGKDLTRLKVDRAQMPGAMLPDRGRMLPFAQPGGAKPIAGGVGWRGLPLRTIKDADSVFRRTACIPPRLRVSAGLRFAVRSLSGALGRENS